MKTIITLLALLALSTTTAAAKPVGKFAAINGLEMYYEVHGSGGRPIVLLHGAFCTIDVCFGKLLPALAKKRQVIAIEQQGHGHTLDIDRPMTIEQFTEDTAALLAKLGVKDADIVGYSIGAGMAMQLAIKHPELVHKLVLISPVFNKAGFHPGLLDGIQQLTPDMMKQTPFYTAYAKASAKPEQWPQVFAHVMKMNASYKDIDPKAVKAVTAPALIVAGDSDIMRPEHLAEMFRLVGGGVMGDSPAGLAKSQLAVLPATTHVTVVFRPELASMIPAFLDAPAK